MYESLRSADLIPYLVIYYFSHDLIPYLVIYYYYVRVLKKCRFNTLFSHILFIMYESLRSADLSHVLFIMYESLRSADLIPYLVMYYLLCTSP